MAVASYMVLLQLCAVSALPLDSNIYVRHRREGSPTESPSETSTVDPDLFSEKFGQNSNFFGSFDPTHNADFRGNSNDNHGQTHETKGDHSQPTMSRHGELPPMALPMSAEKGDNPVALPQKMSQDIPRNEGSHSEANTDSHTDPKQLAGSAQTEGQDMPVALPMTGTEHGDTPVALPQKSGPARKQGVKSAARRPQNAQRSDTRTPGRQRGPPSWSGKGSGGGHGATAPRGSVGQNRDSTQPNRRPPNWSTNEQGGGASSGGGGADSGVGGSMGGMDPMSGLGMAALADGGGTDMFSDMLEMQRKMMFDPQFSSQYMNLMHRYQQHQLNAMNHLMNPDGSSNGSAPVAGPGQGFQYNPMMGMGDEGFMGYGDGGLNMNFMSGYNQALCKDPDSPLCKMASMGMVETQIEGPMGEMDMEPGELDIEGPMAHALLRQLSMGRPDVHPHHQEITLNHHVLDALQNRFGVNTTAGIQQKSNDPQFQAFMFQVMKKSHELAPGEFSANLSRADVTNIMSNLQSTSPVALPRIASSEFAHANLEEVPPKKGEPANHHEAILSIDSGLPSHSSPLVDPQTPFDILGQPGTHEALVQDVLASNTMEEAGEKPETAEKKASTKSSQNVDKSTLSGTQTNNTVSTTNRTSATESGRAPLPAQTENKMAAGQTGLQPTQQTGSQSPSGPIATGTSPQAVFPASEQDIKNKEGNPGLSKDAQTRNQQKSSATNQNTGNNGAGQMSGSNPKTSQTSNSQMNANNQQNTGNNGAGQTSGSNPKTSQTSNSQMNSNNQQSTNADNIPIGIKEAGLYPSSSNNAQVLKKQPTYTTATVFAIFAIVMIALAIIIGPIICMLCKMKEKHDQKKRKLRALKNREISENNIIEAMMLHDLGAKGPMFVENMGATGGNYYKSDPRDVYETIDPELEHLNKQGRESPTGRLP